VLEIEKKILLVRIHFFIHGCVILITKIKVIFYGTNFFINLVKVM
jgi:hypothetical protein